ncbi:ABC transporter substrate-binding protein [Paenibacillus nasutitermitis]|uniref:Peptide ABC transporter substrate-binding protein n=1 Tax=Paenibacillus nasutitermitis TaxID=1652958 RepID=A0A916ZE53_9BACL|nr:ABC transporter substrate-binding protein [Paenibacillus nasutitermitis]GGD89154.1 peptide ABC transporter substrate-binding protein [Paenibacillus nasutitermitis]
MKKMSAIILSILLAAVVLLAGCEDSAKNVNTPAAEDNKSPANNKEPVKDNAEPEKTPDAADPASTEVKEISEFKQSPYLDDKSLPAVKDRLPKDYKITNEMPASQLEYENGTYGGTLRTITAAVDWDADVFVMNNEPLINTPGILGDEITGNVVKEFSMSEDEKTFSFVMREGLKWSDGEPVTTDDVKFTVEDVLMNKEITPIFPVWLRGGGVIDGAPFKLEIADKYNFKLIFDRPYGGLTIRLAIQGWRGYSELLQPAHYLKQFHKKYTPLATLEPLIKKAGFRPGEWVNLFNDKDIINSKLTSKKAIGFPVLYPWMIVKSTETTATFERNPYYFKVDSAGNQLPYIDKIQSTFVQDIEMVALKTIAGEVDFSRESAALIKMPLYRENEKNGYKALLANMHVTPTDIFLNMNFDNKTWQSVVQDKRFRKALNMALNRDEIIDAIYFGFAKPSEMEDSTFDLDGANQLLDEMGMKKGADGIRTTPDGKKFTIPFEIGAQAPDIVPMTQLVVEMWKELGLNVTMKTIDQALWTTRNTANQLQASVVWTHTPLWYMGDWGTGLWAPAWDRWHITGGKEGKAPPEDIKAFFAQMDKAAAAAPEDAKNIFAQIKDGFKENNWYFVPIEEVKQPLIVNAKLHNIPNDASFAIAANFSGEQFWFGN